MSLEIGPKYRLLENSLYYEGVFRANADPVPQRNFLPIDTSGLNDDNAVDIGADGNRWKDIFAMNIKATSKLGLGGTGVSYSEYGSIKASTGTNAGIKFTKGGLEFVNFVNTTSQIGIHVDDTGIASSSLDTNAILELNSSTRGFLPPRNADPATNIVGPANGLVAYDSTDNELQYYNGTSWVSLTSGGGGGGGSTLYTANDSLTGNRTLDGSGNSLTFNNLSSFEVNTNLLIGDGGIGGPYIGLGDDADLKIFHNGSHSIVRETGTGDLYLQSDQNVILSKDSGTEFMVKGIADGAVELYYDNVKKFETSTDGVVLSGDLITGDNRLTYAPTSAGIVSFLDFTVTQFGQTNNTVLSSVKSINFFLDSNGGDSGQAFRIYNNASPDSPPAEDTYIFKVDESGDVYVTGNLSLGDSFIQWDDPNSILRIDGSGSYDGVFIGDPSGDHIAIEGNTDIAIVASAGDAGAYAINNGFGGSVSLQLKAGTTFNSTLEVPEESGTIAIISDVFTISNTAPLTETVDWSNGQFQQVDFELKGAGAVAFTLSNPINGASYTLKITQGANLNTITWPASVLWEGGTPLVPTATDNAIDVVTMVYDGTNYFASYGTNFS